jgi:hypothetical protein
MTSTIIQICASPGPVSRLKAHKLQLNLDNTLTSYFNMMACTLRTAGLSVVTSDV